jgi:hypothetical protein
MTREERAAADPMTLSTPELILRLADLSGSDPAALEGAMRAARLTELEYMCAPGRNDYAGQTPDQIMAVVNRPTVAPPASTKGPTP